MVFDRMEQHPGARFLLVLASLIVVIAGLRAAAPILVPFALALFLAVVSMPVMFGLRIRRVPFPLAIFLTVALDVLIFGLVILLATNSVGSLNDRIPRYSARLTTLINRAETWITTRFDLAPDALNLTAIFDTNQVWDFFTGTLQTVASLFSVAFLVGLIMVFILAEATVFPFKFQAILGHDRTGRIRITKTIEEIQAYLGIKTVISLATGVAAGLFCEVMDLDFPVLLGLVAFVLNFVPTIGSIIAAIPAVLLALILNGPGSMLLVAVGYLGINTLFGNIIEPNLMGRRLGLSTLVVVLSLLFWGWLWGPVGALLSVPLTMVLKIVLENVPDLKWIAVLLDKMPPQARQDPTVPGPRRATAPPSPPVGPADVKGLDEGREGGREGADPSVEPSRATG